MHSLDDVKKFNFKKRNRDWKSKQYMNNLEIKDVWKQGDAQVLWENEDKS